jgi:uncharacterized membrane protein
MRYHEPHIHLESAFGGDAFGRKAEQFARFFGTPKFLIGQSLLVFAWIAVNAVGLALAWDPYPFILLNLAFSTQAAYAAPLILLAQTRQADRDKAHTDADALHREELSKRSLAQAAQTQKLLESNTELTEQTKKLTEHVETLAKEIHGQVVRA